ncbi:phage terminase large subunit family protein [Neptunicoccus cionae]|uniref:Terminase n=1 Tax=Neptunicoccus cionae TaxID=2035344 RepID=A0A916QZY7_9RHOB|nr:terminase gpA endonuclease subunit [Amylibacter cionae]GGA23982.1 terminase [Amylibacter cionae]
MVTLPDRQAGEIPELPPMPPHASAASVLVQALPSLSPATRMGVVDAAEANMKVNANGRWADFDRNTTPYMNEPSDMTNSRLYREVIFAGPARAGKTVMLLATVSHLIVCDPGICRIVHMTENSGEQWVDEELMPMIENSPELSRRQGRGRSDRNILSKKFIGGAKVLIGAPTKNFLSGNTTRVVLFTDIDRMALNIGKEGSPFAMGAKRTETLGSRGMTVAEASPGHVITDPGWRAKTPHEAPPCAGILDLYNGGTRGRWYWDCPECGEAFEPRFERLRYDKTLSPAEAGAAAYMLCPHHGCVIEHSQKIALNRAGYWLHETPEGGLARLDSGDVLKSDRVSYHLNGAAASFASWARLVSKYETALQSYKNGGDESPLQVTINTDQGMPYLPRAMSDEGALTVEGLRALCQPLAQKIAPEWARFLIASVDVQAHYFEVQITAFGLDGRRAIIDRYPIKDAPESAPGAAGRLLEPHTYIEDWDALLPILETVYPVQGQDYGLRVMALACDFHGKPGVSDRATAFWQKRRKLGEVSKWFFVRGHGGFKVEGRQWYRAPLRASDGKPARDIKLLNIATDKHKDTTFASLSRPDGGAGALILGQWMSDDQLKEFTAEMRSDKGWVRRPNMPRNESIDLSGYAQALAEHKGLLKLDPSNPRPWALGGLENTYAVAIADPSRGEAPQIATVARIDPVEQKRKSPRRIAYLD